MNSNIKFTEAVAVLATVDPISQAAGTVTTGWVSVANFHRICAEIQTGIMGTGATLDAKVQQAQDGAGTNAKDVPNKAITTIQAASGNGKQAYIELLPDNDLDTNNGFAYVRLSMSVGVAASLVAGKLFGVAPRFLPASSFNQAGVVQTV
ncbi:hypothetical protein [Burkholderia anthina]|uniref:hypothetical protein n=1 Tax=Burkholderia anthina TaxID=179879 RepID=UPI00158A0125|nr:hypothetical protein [Burkholderia anthina]